MISVIFPINVIPWLFVFCRHRNTDFMAPQCHIVGLLRSDPSFPVIHYVRTSYVPLNPAGPQTSYGTFRGISGC